MTGHCVWHPELPIRNLILWESIHGETVRGKWSLTYLLIESGGTSLFSTAEIKACMEDLVW